MAWSCGSVAPEPKDVGWLCADPGLKRNTVLFKYTAMVSLQFLTLLKGASCTEPQEHAHRASEGLEML